MRIIDKVYQNEKTKMYRFDTLLLCAKFIKFGYVFIDWHKIRRVRLLNEKYKFIGISDIFGINIAFI
jgi:hypothetical protein